MPHRILLLLDNKQNQATTHDDSKDKTTMHFLGMLNTNPLHQYNDSFSRRRRQIDLIGTLGSCLRFAQAVC